MNIDLENIAQSILEAVDYDLAKEDEYNDYSIRTGIEMILEDLVKDIVKQVE